MDTCTGEHSGYNPNAWAEQKASRELTSESPSVLVAQGYLGHSLLVLSSRGDTWRVSISAQASARLLRC